MTWTAAIIVSAKRAKLVDDEILGAVMQANPDQLLVVGDFEDIGNRAWCILTGRGRYLHVPPMTRSTNDALVKRDVAALACTSEWIAYFSDDHKPAEDFGKTLNALVAPFPAPHKNPCARVTRGGMFSYFEENVEQQCNCGAEPLPPLADVYVPARYASQSGHEGERLNNGEASEYIPNVDTAIGHYCGGHAGVYRLSLIQRMPWTAGPHHREWDLLQSRRHMEAGAKYCWTDQLKVFDVEPNARPWE